jgi:hypothetical protein
LRQNFADAGAVINTVGILNEGDAPQDRFAQVHAELPSLIADAAVAADCRMPPG